MHDSTQNCSQTKHDLVETYPQITHDSIETSVFQYTKVHYNCRKDCESTYVDHLFKKISSENKHNSLDKFVVT